MIVSRCVHSCRTVCVLFAVCACVALTFLSSSSSSSSDGHIQLSIHYFKHFLCSSSSSSASTLPLPLSLSSEHRACLSQSRRAHTASGQQQQTSRESSDELQRLKEKINVQPITHLTTAADFDVDVASLPDSSAALRALLQRALEHNQQLRQQHELQQTAHKQETHKLMQEIERLQQHRHSDSEQIPSLPSSSSVPFLNRHFRFSDPLYSRYSPVLPPSFCILLSDYVTSPSAPFRPELFVPPSQLPDQPPGLLLLEYLVYRDLARGIGEARLFRTLIRAMCGYSLIISTFGGSVTAGRWLPQGAWPYPQHVARWFDVQFRKHDPKGFRRKRTQLWNRAIVGSRPSIAALCFTKFLKPYLDKHEAVVISKYPECKLTAAQIHSSSTASPSCPSSSLLQSTFHWPDLTLLDYAINNDCPLDSQKNLNYTSAFHHLNSTFHSLYPSLPDTWAFPFQHAVYNLQHTIKQRNASLLFSANAHQSQSSSSSTHRFGINSESWPGLSSADVCALHDAAVKRNEPVTAIHDSERPVYQHADAAHTHASSSLPLTVYSVNGLLDGLDATDSPFQHSAIHIESVLRKLYSHSNTASMFLHIVQDKSDPNQTSNFIRTGARSYCFEDVPRYYNVPSVSVEEFSHKFYTRSLNVWSERFGRDKSDKVHPNAYGHLVYARLLINTLEAYMLRLTDWIFQQTLKEAIELNLHEHEYTEEDFNSTHSDHESRAKLQKQREQRLQTILSHMRQQIAESAAVHQPLNITKSHELEDDEIQITNQSVSVSSRPDLGDLSSSSASIYSVLPPPVLIPNHPIDMVGSVDVDPPFDRLLDVRNSFEPYTFRQLKYKKYPTVRAGVCAHNEWKMSTLQHHDNTHIQMSEHAYDKLNPLKHAEYLPPAMFDAMKPATCSICWGEHFTGCLGSDYFFPSADDRVGWTWSKEPNDKLGLKLGWVTNAINATIRFRLPPISPATTLSYSRVVSHRLIGSAVARVYTGVHLLRVPLSLCAHSAHSDATSHTTHKYQHVINKGWIRRIKINSYHAQVVKQMLPLYTIDDQNHDANNASTFNRSIICSPSTLFSSSSNSFSSISTAGCYLSGIPMSSSITDVAHINTVQTVSDSLKLSLFTVPQLIHAALNKIVQQYQTHMHSLQHKLKLSDAQNEEDDEMCVLMNIQSQSLEIQNIGYTLSSIHFPRYKVTGLYLPLHFPSLRSVVPVLPHVDSVSGVLMNWLPLGTQIGVQEEVANPELTIMQQQHNERIDATRRRRQQEEKRKQGDKRKHQQLLKQRLNNSSSDIRPHRRSDRPVTVQPQQPLSKVNAANQQFTKVADVAKQKNEKQKHARTTLPERIKMQEAQYNQQHKKHKSPNQQTAAVATIN